MRLKSLLTYLLTHLRSSIQRCPTLSWSNHRIVLLYNRHDGVLVTSGKPAKTPAFSEIFMLSPFERNSLYESWSCSKSNMQQLWLIATNITSTKAVMAMIWALMTDKMIYLNAHSLNWLQSMSVSFNPLLFFSCLVNTNVTEFTSFDWHHHWHLVPLYEAKSW